MTVVAAARARMALMLTDTITFTRGSGEWVFDPETGLSTPTEGTEIYSGACKIRNRDVAASDRQVAGQEVTLHPYEVVLPVTATTVEVGDRGLITASQDPGAVAMYLTVDSVQFATFSAGRRLLCHHDQG